MPKSREKELKEESERRKELERILRGEDENTLTSEGKRLGTGSTQRRAKKS